MRFNKYWNLIFNLYKLHISGVRTLQTRTYGWQYVYCIQDDNRTVKKEACPNKILSSLNSLFSGAEVSNSFIRISYKELFIQTIVYLCFLVLKWAPRMQKIRQIQYKYESKSASYYQFCRVYTRAPGTVFNSKVRVYVELLVFLLYSERPSVTRMKTLSLYYHYFITTYKLTFYS